MSDEDVLDLPLVDASQVPIHLYTQDGYPVQRRRATFNRSTSPFGVLIKSGNLEQLFTSSINSANGEHDQPQTPNIPFTFYPQAGLRTVGHFQAKGLMAPCYSLVSQLNKDILASGRRRRRSAHNAEDSDSDSNHSASDEGSESDMSVDDEMANSSQRKRKIIHPISSQGYNAVTHHTRGRKAQHHEVQIGMVTGALAGAWATGTKNKNTAHRLDRDCSLNMPHQLFAEKIGRDEIPRDFRFENVYWIDIGALPKRHQNGRQVRPPMSLIVLTHTYIIDSSFKKHCSH